MKIKKKKIIKTLLLLSLTFATASAFAQELKMDKSYYISVEQLPEYIIVQSEGVRLIGKKVINIDHKNSDYELVLGELEDLLTGRKKPGIQNPTDLLNTMSDLGFDYVDAFSVGQGDLTNIVFRKKPEYRN